jgi:predicted XRE-type DNA-binding protein
MKYPDKERVLKVLDMIQKKKLKSLKVPPIDAPALDKMKFNICQKILKFKMDNNYSSKDLALILDVSPAMISRIAQAEIEKFKIDSLLSYYETLLVTKNNKKVLNQFNKTISKFLKDLDEAA